MYNSLTFLKLAVVSRPLPLHIENSCKRLNVSLLQGGFVSDIVRLSVLDWLFCGIAFCLV
jgi:hypothetical protein